MPVTLKCPDCGHSVQADDDTPRTCPQCEGTMKKPAYKAKSGPTSSDRAKPADKPKPKPKDDEDEDRPKKKPVARRDDDEDELKPKKAVARPAKQEEALSLDDDGDAGEGEKGGGEATRDGRAAESLGIDPGFKNKRLMRQVEEELSRGEVLHWVGRMCPEIAQKSAGKARLAGIVVAGAGVLFSAIFFAVAPWYAGLIPLIFVIIGVALAILGPKVTLKAAELGWYAITDRRAIVYAPSAFGSGGRTTSYEPRELRRMRVQKSNVVDGAGDLIFKTTVTTHVHTNRDSRGRTSTSESTSEHHEGFLGIENVREVETLVHNVLLEGDGDDDTRRRNRDDEDEE